MPKTEVYTWRVSRATKTRLEDTARAEGRPVAELLERLVTAHLERPDDADAAAQERLHQQARRFAGCLAGRDPARAEHARPLIRARLMARRRNVR